MIIVTSGAKYIDIDAYACCVAYAELLQLQGMNAQAASSAVWNESITQSMTNLNAPFRTNYQTNNRDTYVIMDVSDPSKFDNIVAVDRVTDVLDHHPGFEDFWKERIGNKSKIDFIGAAATLVYEEWVKAGKTEDMSLASAELLAAALLDNTLNFGAGVTTERDRAAYKFLTDHASLDDKWVARYFTDCQRAIVADLCLALKNDTKFLQFPGLNEELCFGQVVIWNADSIISSKLAVISDTLSSMRGCWLANLVSISNGRSYFLSDNTEVQNWLTGILDITFEGMLANADKLWLRKEIMMKGLA